MPGPPKAGSVSRPTMVGMAIVGAAPAGAFAGFPRDTVTFLRALARNNHETWMETNRDRYEAAILTPARQCVVAVGRELHQAGCRVVADPRVNGSIFRLARDRRFRPDAPPYKTHLALVWWADAGARMEQPSFYLQITGKAFEFGVGLPEVPRERLPAFRRWLVERDHAARMTAAMAHGSAADVEWTLTQLKRPPLEFRGLQGPKADVVRFTGGWGGWTIAPHPPELFSPSCSEWLVERYRPLMPFWRVLAEGLAR